ncbi:MAG: bis-aminopropyl spermidine synthase family protein [Bacteroidales bacterium]|nr:bis-aminopropyl spermidine synthase family protein [Bacteroidales bacterium]
MAKIDSIVQELYDKYLKKLPLDLCKENFNSINVRGWKKNVQLTIFDFCRILKILKLNNNLKELTRSGIDLDLDNIEPIISLLIEEKIMIFDKKNHYAIEGLNYNKMKNVESKINILDNPQKEFHQFPCSKDSVLKRVQTLVDDFPFVTSLKIGLLGDDDLLSVEIARRTNFQPIVFEIDQLVINKIKSIANKERLNIKIVKEDLIKIVLLKHKLDTFITDPPYTVGGILTFLYHGINCLKTKDRFYVIANQMFLGYSGIYEILKNLINAGIYPIKILNAYNEYPNPDNYRESTDIINRYGDKIDPSQIENSTSSLFVFRIYKDYDTGKVIETILKEKNIYDRYRRFSNV